MPALDFIGELPTPSGGNSNITSLYTAKFGALAESDKVFIKIVQTSNGWQDVGRQFSQVVPADS